MDLVQTAFEIEGNIMKRIGYDESEMIEIVIEVFEREYIEMKKNEIDLYLFEILKFDLFEQTWHEMSQYE